MGNDVGGPIGTVPTLWQGNIRGIWSGNLPPVTSASGTDTTPVVTEEYVAEVAVPYPGRSNGFQLFNGSAVAGNVTVILYNASGAMIGKSASTAASGTDALQRIPWLIATNLQSGTYYVGVQCNNVAMRLNTHPFGGFGASKKTGQVYGTVTALTPPTTFTAGVGPMGALY